MALNRGDGRTERVRCTYCQKAIPAAANAIAASGGLLFDSLRCKQRYLRRGALRALSNATRVARSRLKARTIGKAQAVYRALGGRDWSVVRMVLAAVL